MILATEVNKGDKTPEKFIARIKNMLELQRSATTEGEAAAATAAVQRELTRHKLELSDVEMFQVITEEPVEEQRVEATDYGFQWKRKRQSWLQDLASAVSRAHFCRILIREGSNTIWFVGRKSNREVAVKSFGYLANVCEELCDHAAKEYKRTFKEQYEYGEVDTKNFKDSFRHGFVSAVSSRMWQETVKIREEQEEAAEAEAKARREAEIEARLEENKELIEDRALELIDVYAERAEQGDEEAATKTLDDMLMQAEDEVEANIRATVEAEPLEVNSQALVRLKTEQKAVEDYMDEKFNSGRRRGGRSAGVIGRRSSHNSAGYNAGRARGASVSTSGNVLKH